MGNAVQSINYNIVACRVSTLVAILCSPVLKWNIPCSLFLALKDKVKSILNKKRHTMLRQLFYEVCSSRTAAHLRRINSSDSGFIYLVSPPLWARLCLIQWLHGAATLRFYLCTYAIPFVAFYSALQSLSSAFCSSVPLGSSTLAPLSPPCRPDCSLHHLVHITLQHSLSNKSSLHYFLSLLSAFGS